MRAIKTLTCIILLLALPAVAIAQNGNGGENAALPERPKAPYVKEDADALQAHIDATQAGLESAKQALTQAEEAAAEEGLSDEQQASRDEAVTRAKAEVERLTGRLSDLRAALAVAEEGPTREQLEARREYDRKYTQVMQIRRDLQVRVEGAEGADGITEGEFARRIREAEEEQRRIEDLSSKSEDFEFGKSRIYEKLSDLEKLDYERRWASQRLQLSIDAYDHLSEKVFGAYRAYEKRAHRGMRNVEELSELWKQIEGTPAVALEIPEPAKELASIANSTPGEVTPAVEIERWYKQRVPSAFRLRRGTMFVSQWENRLRAIQQEIDVREDYMERLEQDAERLKEILAQAEADALDEGSGEEGLASGQEIQEYKKLGNRIDALERDVIDNRNEIEKLEEERVGLVQIHAEKLRIEGEVQAQVRETEALIAAIEWRYIPEDKRPEDAEAPTVSDELLAEIEAEYAKPHIRVYILQERVKAERERLSSAKRDTRQANTQIEILDKRVERLTERNKEIEEELLPQMRERYYEEIGKTVGIRAGKVAIVLVIAWFTLFLIRRLGEPLIERIVTRADKAKGFNADEKQRARTLMTVFMTTARLVVYITAIMFAISQFDVDYGPLLVAAGGVSLAVGFGAQTLVRDFFAGFFILLEGQYSIGDVVEVGGRIGTVEHIGLRTTVLRSLNGDVHTIPNGEIVSTTNMTKLWSRAVVDVGIAYEENVDEVGEVIQAVAREMREDEVWGQKVLDSIYMGVQSLSDSSVVLRILLKTRAGEQWGASREFNRRCKLKFDELGVEIPWPQRVVSYKDYAEKSEDELKKEARAKRATLLRYVRRQRGEEEPEDAALAAMSVEERDRAQTMAKHQTELATEKTGEQPEPTIEAVASEESKEGEGESISAAEQWAKKQATMQIKKADIDERRKEIPEDADEADNTPGSGDADSDEK